MAGLLQFGTLPLQPACPPRASPKTGIDCDQPADWCWGMAALQVELPDILLDREVNGRREPDLRYSHLDWWVRFR